MKTPEELQQKTIDGLNDNSVSKAEFKQSVDDWVSSVDKPKPAPPKSTPVWPYIMVAIIVAVYLFVSICNVFHLLQ